MKVSRIRAGLAIGGLSIVLTAAPAAAQLQGCGFSVCPDEEEQRPPGVVVTVPGEAGEGEELGTTTSTTLIDELPAGETTGDLPAQTAAPSGELPFTGGDVAGLALIGGVALATGAVLVRRSKARA